MNNLIYSLSMLTGLKVEKLRKVADKSKMPTMETPNETFKLHTMLKRIDRKVKISAVRGMLDPMDIPLPCMIVFDHSTDTPLKYVYNQEPPPGTMAKLVETVAKKADEHRRMSEYESALCNELILGYSTAVIYTDSKNVPRIICPGFIKNGTDVKLIDPKSLIQVRSTYNTLTYAAKNAAYVITIENINPKLAGNAKFKEIYK